MTALRREIAELIAGEGPISVERYMALALSHPRHGYYRSRDPFGAQGDFVTAPEISQMFGELIGLWAADCWARMGEPARFAFVELGPGRGTLMADALRAARIVPRFLEAAQVHLVETSEILRARQRDTLAQAGTMAAMPVTWHEGFAEIPEGPLILIANEFFDALPIRQYMRAGERWRERLIGLDGNGALAFGLSAKTETALRLDAPEGAIFEMCPDGLALTREIAARLVTNGGAALLIDYGHLRQGFGDTLQAVRRHAFVDPLLAPGEADLTAHVDFAALGRVARDCGGRAARPGDARRVPACTRHRGARTKAEGTRRRHSGSRDRCRAHAPHRRGRGPNGRALQGDGDLEPIAAVPCWFRRADG